MKPHILFIARDDGGCGFYRCQQPAKFLIRAGLATALVKLNKASEEEMLAADLVVMQETGSVNAGDHIRFLITNKIPYLAEFDDFVHHVSPHNTGGFPAWNPATLYIHRAMEQARSAFGMTLSTPQMAREYFPYNETIYVVPNYLDKDIFDVSLARKNDGKIRIGWAGGNAHADDLFMISRVIDKLIKEYKGKVIFETMGMSKQELHGVFPFEEFMATCPHCGYEGELHHFPGEELHNYPMILAGKGWDIALAPVINNSFGNAKSDLKIKEYAAIGIPVVASNVVPYIEAKRDGSSVLLAETFEEWYNNIKALIKNHAKRQELARQNKEWVEKYWIQDNIPKIFEVYSQTIAKADMVFGPKGQRLKSPNS